MNIEDVLSTHRQDEGLSLRIYKDTNGISTIGYGINLEVGIDLEEAEMLLRYRTDKAIKSAKNIVDNFDLLKEPAQHVIVNMIYNIGATGFSKFTKMIAGLEDTNYKVALDEFIDSKYYRSHPNRGRIDNIERLLGSCL